MEIHSSSLRSVPAKLGPAQSSKLTAVQNNVTQKDAKSSYKKPEVQENQETAQVKTDFILSGDLLYNETYNNESLGKPVNTRIQQALNAYHGQRYQALQNQRAELVAGVDLYV